METMGYEFRKTHSQKRKEEIVMRLMTSRPIKIISLVFLTLATLLCVEGTCPLGAAEPIKIGAVFAISGWAGSLGSYQNESTIITREKINRQGGILGRPLEIYIEDDQSNSTNAAVAATKLVRDKKVCAVMGGTLTVFCQSMIPVFEREQVPFVALGSGSEITYPLKKWVFQVTPTDILLAPKMLEFTVRTLGARKIALFHCTDATGMSGAQGVKKNVANYSGVSIVITEKFDPKDTNMIPQLTNIKATHPDAIILYGPSPCAAVIAKNYQQLEMEIPVVGTHAIPTPEFIKLAGKIVENGRWVILSGKSNVGDKMPPDDPWRKKRYDPFLRELKEKYGENKKYSSFMGLAHDGIIIIKEALNIAGTDDRAALRNALEKVSYDGLASTYKYSPTDHNGVDIDEAVVPVIIRNGELWPYKK